VKFSVIDQQSDDAEFTEALTVSLSQVSLLDEESENQMFGNFSEIILMRFQFCFGGLKDGTSVSKILSKRPICTLQIDPYTAQ
jgi:hypothetical protein